MRTIAALLAALLLAALPLVAAAQQAPPPAQPAAPPATWETVPAPAPAAPSAPAPAAPAEPQPAAPPAAPAQAAPPPAYPPPPQYAPPPPYPPPYPPPQYLQPPAKQRGSWYIGFGFGSGDGTVSNEFQSASFQEMNLDRSTTAAFFNFKVGATMTPRVLLGADITAITALADEGGTATDVTISNVDAVATYFPTGKGFFLRAGLGASSITYAVDTAFESAEGTASGFNVLGGLGYAFWLGRSFNLTLNLDLSRQWYGESDELNVDDSGFWALWMGFDWY